MTRLAGGLAILAWLALTVATPAAGQDGLSLREVQEAAVARDARARQLDLQERSHALRLANLSSERLPRLVVHGEATHQSDVPSLPIAIPGVEVPEPPRQRYQVAISADQLIYDGGSLRERVEVEDARRAEAEAEVRAALHPVRVEATEAFFAVLLLNERESELHLLIADLDAMLARSRSQVRAGVALAGDTLALEAERLRAGQTLSRIEADRRVQLAVLSGLTGMEIEVGRSFELPDLSSEVASAGGAAGSNGLIRPELVRLARTRDRLAAEAEAARARERPRLSAVGVGGIGRPGPFEVFSDEPTEFWQVGVRFEWRPWSWGAVAREAELLRVRSDVIATEEAALVSRLGRDLEREAQEIARLKAAVVTDVRIVALREQIERQARSRLEERVITAAEYVDVRTAVLEARVAGRRTAVELERARARYLLVLGITGEER